MTAKVSFKEQPSRTVRETPPPTFLFLPSSIVKKQTKHKVPSHPKPQNKPPKPKPSPGPNNPSNQETSERVHPSPAAPPPSLVKRVIKLPQQTSQRRFCKNIEVFSAWQNINYDRSPGRLQDEYRGQDAASDLTGLRRPGCGANVSAAPRTGINGTRFRSSSADRSVRKCAAGLLRSPARMRRQLGGAARCCRRP